MHAQRKTFLENYREKMSLKIIEMEMQNRNFLTFENF